MGRPAAARPGSHEEIAALIDVARRFAASAPQSIGPRIAHLNALGATAADRSADPAAHLVREVMTLVAAAWERVAA